MFDTLSNTSPFHNSSNRLSHDRMGCLVNCVPLNDNTLPCMTISSSLSLITHSSRASGPEREEQKVQSEASMKRVTRHTRTHLWRYSLPQANPTMLAFVPVVSSHGTKCRTFRSARESNTTKVGDKLNPKKEAPKKKVPVARKWLVRIKVLSDANCSKAFFGALPSSSIAQFSFQTSSSPLDCPLPCYTDICPV
jgi:hypothetical protein